MDDELLRALGRAQRQQDPMPTPVSTDPSVQAPGIADVLTRPLDEAERARVLDAVFGRLDAEAPAAVEVAPPVAPVVAIGPSGSRARGGVMAAVGVVVAIAAALVLWFGRPTTPIAELPSYALTELRGGVAEMRSEPGAVDRVVDLRPGGTIELVVTPAVASAEPLVVDLVAQGDGTPDRMVRVNPEISKSGAVRVSGVLTEMIVLEPGAWTITVVVSPAAAAPGDVKAALSGTAGRRVSFRLNLRERE